MSAMERFEYMERDSENKNAEKNIEKNTQINEIKTKEDLKDEIQSFINSYRTVKELESIGIDGETAEVVKNMMKESIEIGIQKSLITEEEKNAYYEELNKIDDEERNDQNERDEQKEKREEKEIEEEEKSEQNKEQNIEENQKEEIEKEQEENIEKDKPVEENSQKDEIKEPENLRDKKMSINEWCKESAFEQYYYKEDLLESIKRCGKDIYGKDITIDNIDLDKEISMDEFYEIQINVKDHLFGKKLAPKTQEFINEYYPALAKEALSLYLDNNMSYATITGDKKLSEAHKKAFDGNFNMLKEIAGKKDEKNISEIEKVYNSMGRDISNSDQYSRNKIRDSLTSIIENADKDIQEYGVKDKEQDKVEQQEDKKRFVGTKHSEENIKVGTGTVVQSHKDNQPLIMQTEEWKRAQTGDIQKAMENANIKAAAPVGQKVGNRLDEQRYQPLRNTYNEYQNIEKQTTKEKSLAVIPERKGFINWVKEKFNSIKKFFSKNKSNDIQLGETGQAGQDYIDAQEGNENKTETSKRKSFVNNITMNNKLKNQEQQKKAFEAVKKWEEKNKNAIEQENDDKEIT